MLIKRLFYSSIYLVIIFLTSCSSLSDEDAVFFVDRDNVVEEHDFDINDDTDSFVQNSSNLNIDISFRSRPHGITRWNEEYRYYVKCSSLSGFETHIRVSAKDTCKGSINSNLYTFTPKETAFPEGNCLLSVICFNNTGSRTQTSVLKIPNPSSVLPELHNKGYVFNFINSHGNKDYFALTSAGSTIFGKEPETLIYKTDPSSGTLAFVNKIPGQAVSVLFTEKDSALITDGRSLYSYYFNTKKKTELAYSEGCTETVQSGPMQREDIYYSGVVGSHLRIGKMTLFGLHNNNDYCYQYTFFTTDGTPEGTTGHGSIIPSTGEIPLDRIVRTHKDKYGGFYYHDDFYFFYVDNAGNPAFKTEANDYNFAGFDGNSLFYIFKDNQPNRLISIREGKTHRQYTAPENRYIENARIIDGNLFAIEYDHNTKYMILFPSGDLDKEPQRVELFKDKKYDSIGLVATTSGYAIFSGYVKNLKTMYLRKIVFDHNGIISVSGQINYIKNAETLSNPTLVGSYLLYEDNSGNLISIDTGKINSEANILENGCEPLDYSDIVYSHYGTDISHETVITYFKQSDGLHYLAKTDGTKEHYKNIYKSGFINIWNGLILENDMNFIVEESGELIHRNIFMETISEHNLYRTDKNIFLIINHDINSQSFYVYTFPEIY